MKKKLVLISVFMIMFILLGSIEVNAYVKSDMYSWDNMAANVGNDQAIVELVGTRGEDDSHPGANDDNVRIQQDHVYDGSGVPWGEEKDNTVIYDGDFYIGEPIWIRIHYKATYLDNGVPNMVEALSGNSLEGEGSRHSIETVDVRYIDNVTDDSVECYVKIVLGESSLTRIDMGHQRPWFRIRIFDGNVSHNDMDKCWQTIYIKFTGNIIDENLENAIRTREDAEASIQRYENAITETEAELADLEREKQDWQNLYNLRNEAKEMNFEELKTRVENSVNSNIESLGGMYILLWINSNLDDLYFDYVSDIQFPEGETINDYRRRS